MNKTHRIVWSESRGAFIVTHEHAATSGKRSSTKSIIAQSLAVAALVAGSAPTLAQTVTLGAGQSENNGAGAVIQGNSGLPGIYVPGVAAVAITNSGTILSSTGPGDSGTLLFGVYVDGGGALSGGITNSGSLSLIDGVNIGINVISASSVSNVLNQGSISGQQAGIAVSSGGSISSITNSASGVINVAASGGNGIQVNGGTVGSITNSGSITAGSSGIGILVENAGKVGSISNSGTIYGSDNAIQINGSGSTVTSIINSGQLSAGSSAIGIYNSAAVGSISNSGTITGGQSSDGISIYVGSVGSISNSGVITGNYAGVQIQNASTVTSLSNSGVISGNQYGVLVEGSTLTSLTNLGTISGTNQAGVALQSGAVVGSVSNAGAIFGQNAGILVTNSTISGSILNSSGGTISATGLNYYYLTVSGSQYYVEPSGIVAVNANIGSIVNQKGGVITGASGIYLQNSTLGSLQNAGLITASQGYGVTLVEDTIGSITNTGSIGGAYIGLLVSDSTTTGSITNSGSISGNYGAIITGGTLAGGITNSGTMAGTVYSGLSVEDMTFTGGIHNKAGGVISGASGLTLYYGTVDSITNDAGGKILGVTPTNGTVDQLGYAGVALHSGATLSGNLTNNGLISGVTAGIALNGSASMILGSIINTGTVMGAGAGITLNGTGSFLQGGIFNSGTIEGGQYGVSIIGLNETTLSGGISNSGLISGTSVAGVFITATTVSGGITNAASGTITGGGEGIALDTATLAGGLSNAGLISGGVQGLLLTNSAMTGGLSNSGTILGGQQGASLTGSTITGGLSNSGTIAGGVTGLAVKAMSTVSGGLSNSGVIYGSKYAINVDATSSVGPITISGNNSAAFGGDVLALNSPVTVASGTYTGSNAFNVQSFDVAAGALFNMGAMDSTAGEANGIAVSNGVTNEGTLSVARNTAVITGSYTQAASGVFGVGVSSKTNHGVLAINGAANLTPNANILVDIAANNTLTNKETIAGVLTSTDLTASTFKVTDNSDLISFKGLVDGNNVDLVTSFNALVLPDTLSNKNSNAVGAATVLDQIILASSGVGPFTGVINDIAKLQSSRQVSNAASQTLPVLSGAVGVSTYAALTQMNQVVQARQAGNYGMSAGSPYLLDQNAWIKPFGSWTDASSENGAPGYNANVAGVALGGDAAISNAARVGLAFAYANVDVSGNLPEAPNNDRINMYQLIGYGSYAIDAQTEVNAQIDGGINSNDGHRNIEFAGTTATSSFNSSDAHFGIGIARSLPLSEATVFTPEVRVDYTWISTDDYSEGGAGPLSLNTKSTSFESLLTQVNGKLTQKVNDNLTVFGNLGFGYDSMAHNNSSVVAAFSGAPGLSFSTQGVGLSPRALLGGIGLVSIPRGNMPELSLKYDTQQREGFSNNSISFKARWAF